MLWPYELTYHHATSYLRLAAKLFTTIRSHSLYCRFTHTLAYHRAVSTSDRYHPSSEPELGEQAWPWASAWDWALAWELDCLWRPWSAFVWDLRLKWPLAPPPAPEKESESGKAHRLLRPSRRTLRYRLPEVPSILIASCVPALLS